MIRCHKCDIEKEDKFFQTYWHSTQQKYRTRKECTECMYKQRNERKRLKRQEKSKLIEHPTPTEIIQPAVPELELEVFEEVSIEYKKCTTCNISKPLDQYYRNSSIASGRNGRCIECENEKSRKERLEELKENGGSLRRYEQPNKYYDEYQKEATFNILLAMGWHFNEDKGIWWKEGIKTEDGEFLNIKSRPKKIFTRKHVTEEQSDLMVKMYLDGNYKNDIAEHLGISKLTVYKHIKKYENDKGR